jgi:hypothetical protein
MPPILNTTLHALLVIAWMAAGYCFAMLAAHPCQACAVGAAAQTATACALLWAVWPRKVVAHV